MDLISHVLLPNNREKHFLANSKGPKKNTLLDDYCLTKLGCLEDNKFSLTSHKPVRGLVLGHDDDSLALQVHLDLFRSEPLDVDDQLEVVVLHLGHGGGLSQGVLLHLE